MNLTMKIAARETADLPPSVKSYFSGRIRAGLEKATNQFKAELRDDVRANLNSRRLPTTWRSEIYPAAGVETLGPASLIYSKAPLIISVFSDGATIKPTHGQRFLWIPTKDCPRSGRRPMKPEQVETQFGGFGFARTGRGYVAYVDAKRTNASVRGNNPLRGQVRTSQRGSGPVEKIVMFVLLPQVTLARRLNTRAIFARAERTWSIVLASALDGA